MSTDILVKHVEKAVKTLKVQVSKVERLKKGLHVKRDEIHMNDEESKFLAWMESEGAYLKEHIHGDTIPNIASLHAAWFIHYKKIYELYFNSKSHSWFKDKNLPKALDEQDKDRLVIYYADLMEVHEMLLKKFSILLQRVSSSRAVDDADIKSSEKIAV